MKNLKLRVATWIVSRFVPIRDREALIGDLTEEHARLTKAGLPDAPSGWYLRHIWASIPPLLWAGLARATWPMTLGIALAAYILICSVQGFVSWTARGPATMYCPVELGVFFPIALLVGYLAERIRPRTSIVCGTLLLLTVAAMIVWDWYGGNAPLQVQKQLPWLVLGPAVMWIGVATDRRRSSAR